MNDYTPLFDQVFVAYDGSPTADHIFPIFKAWHTKVDRSVFVNVADPLKNYIPNSARGEFLEKKLKEELEGLKQVDIKVVKKQKGDNKSTNEILLGEVFASKCTFMMIGFVGQKGRKPRDIELSSRVRRFVYDTKIPIAIVNYKNRPQIKKACEEKNSVLFCFDGSQVSREGLKKCIGFCKKSQNSLTILHTYNQDCKQNSKQVKTYLKTIQNEYGKAVPIEMVIEEGSLVSHLEELNSKHDWIMMNRNGYRGQISNRKYVGSKTTEVLTTVEANLIILN